MCHYQLPQPERQRAKIAIVHDLIRNAVGIRNDLDGVVARPDRAQRKCAPKCFVAPDPLPPQQLVVDIQRDLKRLGNRPRALSPSSNICICLGQPR
jgi:hypothetical protein